MVRNKTRRRRELTDQQLLTCVSSELRGLPRVATTGRASATRTAPFSAHYRSRCERCGRWIERGNDVRYHRDFDGVVHSGCRPPAVTVTRIEEKVVVTNARHPELCPHCRIEHAGECW
jgi:hypothetical protein